MAMYISEIAYKLKRDHSLDSKKHTKKACRGYELMKETEAQKE